MQYVMYQKKNEYKIYIREQQNAGCYEKNKNYILYIYNHIRR